ncbi:Wzz/FepE/Etk N-terminal domain-containing protein [Spirillospora sp. CA-253888]
MAADQAAEPQGQLLAIFRRYALLIGLLAVLGGAAGAGAAMILPAPYTATATVLVSPLEGNPYSPQGRGDDLINLETEAQLISTDTVAKLAARRLGRTPGGTVSVTVPPNTQVLNLTYTAGGAQEARGGAQAFAESYLDYRRQRAQAVVDGRLKKLQDQSKRVERALRTANQEMRGATGAQRAYLSQRITAYTNQLGVIDEQANDIGSTPINAGQVITPAGLPPGSGGMRMVMFAGGGLAAGLVLGVLIMLLRERVNQRLRDAEGIEALGVRTLSTVPPGDPLALVSAPKSAAGEAYRRLRAAVVATAPKTPVAILVSNATPGSGARRPSANLAVSLAFAGAGTIMIDATGEDADLAELFGLQPAKGLSDALLQGTDPAELLVQADSQLRLLPRGPRAAEAAHRFSGPRMREAVKLLRRRADFLIINAPSLHDADAQALMTFVDAVILVVDRGVTTRQELRQAHIEAERAGVTVLGAVLEPADPGGKQRARQQPARPPARPAARPQAGPQPARPQRTPEAEAAVSWAEETPAEPARNGSYWPGPYGADKQVASAETGHRAAKDPQPRPPAPAEDAEAEAPANKTQPHRVVDVDPSATKTQEDVSKYVEDPPDEPGPEVAPRYSKNHHKAGRHGGS